WGSSYTSYDNLAKSHRCGKDGAGLEDLYHPKAMKGSVNSSHAQEGGRGLGLEERVEVNVTIFEEMELFSRVVKTIKEAGSENSNCNKKKETTAHGESEATKETIEETQASEEDVRQQTGVEEGKIHEDDNL
ncbi:hypothetical protein U1Q18_008614, partial [Sarracenia purpurea var. burkii]